MLLYIFLTIVFLQEPNEGVHRPRSLSD